MLMPGSYSQKKTPADQGPGFFFRAFGAYAPKALRSNGAIYDCK